MIREDLEQLTSLLARYSYRKSTVGPIFQLASGALSDTLIDASQVTRHPDGFALLRRLLPKFVCMERDIGRVFSVGGPALGSEPLCAAVVAECPTLSWFAVRDTAKGRGLDHGCVTGWLRPPCVILEDVVTTGGTVARAIELVGKDNVCGVVALVDRGGGERIEQLGIHYVALTSLALIEQSR